MSCRNKGARYDVRPYAYGYSHGYSYKMGYNYGYGIPAYRKRISGDGYCETGGVQRCGHVPHACEPIVKRVTCIRPSCDCNEPILIEVTGLFNELAANNCFDLVFCPDTLEMSNTAPVVLTDGDEEFLLMEGFTGNTVKYDQLTRVVDWRHDPLWGHCWRDGKIVLRCYYGNEGPAHHKLHIMVNTPLPKSTHAPKRFPAGVPLRDEASI